MKVQLSIGNYIDWKWNSKDDEERLRGWATEVMKIGWKGIKEEYKVLSDIPEGYLPKYIFISGFEEAVKICGSEESENELDPTGGLEIEIEWVD